MVVSPAAPISALPLLTDPERHQLLTTWNQTERAFAHESCLHELIDAQAHRSPDAMAVTIGDRQLSYQQLNARANQLAHYLQRLGVGPEVRVGICAQRSLEMVVALLGI